MTELDDTTTVLAKKLLDSLVGMHNVLSVRAPETDYEEGKRDGWVIAVNYLRRLVCVFAGVERVAPMTEAAMQQVPVPNIQQLQPLSPYSRVTSAVAEIFRSSEFAKPDLSQAEAIVTAFYARYPELLKWHQRAEQIVKEQDGRGTSVFGRRRRFCTCDSVGECAGTDEGAITRDCAVPLAEHEGSAGNSGLQADGSSVDRNQAPSSVQGGDSSVQGEAAQDAGGDQGR